MNANRQYLLRLLIIGAVIGFLYALVEYYFRPTLLIPLIIRSVLGGSMMFGTIGVFELAFRNLFRRKSFLLLLLTKSIVYVIIILFWLSILNGINSMIINNDSFFSGVVDYFRYSDMVEINLVSLFLIILIINIIIQINSLHRKSELGNFILGRYHKPKERERIFLFIDLSSSTTIAERLGHFQYGSFLQEYYLDISKAINMTGGEAYDYIGDEVVVSWPLKKEHQMKQCIECIFQIRSILLANKDNYERKYGVTPGFKAGAHGGKVIVMWVGDHKKEIMYVGDVLNTAKRIQTECARLSTDFLISGELVYNFPELTGFQFTQVDKLLLRGKSYEVEIYSVDRPSTV